MSSRTPHPEQAGNPGGFAEKYRRLENNIPGMVYEFLLRADGTYAFPYVSRKSRDLFGLDPEEIVRDASRLTGMRHPEDVAKMDEAIRTSAETLRPFRFEVRHIVDGEVRWHDCISRPERRSNGDILWEGLLLDITERKRAEAALREGERDLRNIVASSPVGISIYDATGQCLSTNESLARMIGATTEQVLAQNLNGIRSWEVSGLRDKALVAMRQGIPQRHEVETESSFGAPVSLDCHLVPFGEGGLLFMAQDITERRRAERERVSLEAQLRQMQKIDSIGRLAGGVAHDFNNQLTVIFGCLELIRSRALHPDAVAKYLGEMEKAAGRSRDVVRQLLSFSRRQVTRSMPLDLNAQVRDMLATLRRLIGEEVEIRFHAAPDLWTTEFDPSQLAQILMNLAINARDAMPSGGMLAIATGNRCLNEDSCRRFAAGSPGDYVLLEVADSGGGMSQDVRDRIFEPYFTTKELGKGTGLGLATVHGIVTRAGGIIDVESEPGEGAVFRIYLPRRSELARHEASLPGDPAVRGTECILLVEDDPAVRELTQAMLEDLGYTVLPAASAAEALDICRAAEAPIDLLLTDVVMPGMRGTELAAAMTSRCPGIRTVLMSGHPEDAVLRPDRPEERRRFVQKPFSRHELAACVAGALAEDGREPPAG